MSVLSEKIERHALRTFSRDAAPALPPAVAADPSPIQLPTVSADAAGGHGNHFNMPHAEPVAGIAPVDGWTLWAWDDLDGDRFTRPAYFARHADRDVMLAVSRFRFTPTQERFAWLVESGFPRRRGIGPWDDAEIDHEIASARTIATGIRALPFAFTLIWLADRILAGLEARFGIWGALVQATAL